VIGWLRSTARVNRRLERRVFIGARSPRQHLAGADRSRLSGLGFGRDLVQENARGVDNPSGRLAQAHSGWDSTLGGGGGSVRRGSPAFSAPAVGLIYGLRNLAQKGPER
jgi:hypothetical protein